MAGTGTDIPEVMAATARCLAICVKVSLAGVQVSDHSCAEMNFRRARVTTSSILLFIL